jgi:hypothetical protein
MSELSGPMRDKGRAYEGIQRLSKAITHLTGVLDEAYPGDWPEGIDGDVLFDMNYTEALFLGYWLERQGVGIAADDDLALGVMLEFMSEFPEVFRHWLAARTKDN